MAKAKQEQVAAPVQALGSQISGRFYTVVKTEHLLYIGVEITVRDGVVTATKILSRAPDMAQSAVGHCSREVWNALREQTLETTGLAK